MFGAVSARAGSEIRSGRGVREWSGSAAAATAAAAVAGSGNRGSRNEPRGTPRRRCPRPHSSWLRPSGLRPSGLRPSCPCWPAQQSAVPPVHITGLRPFRRRILEYLSAGTVKIKRICCTLRWGARNFSHRTGWCAGLQGNGGGMDDSLRRKWEHANRREPGAFGEKGREGETGGKRGGKKSKGRGCLRQKGIGQKMESEVGKGSRLLDPTSFLAP